jgi:uncharacterized protein YqeY
MTLQNSINDKIKSSMKSGDSLRLNVYRSLKNAISNAALQSGNIQSEISDDKALAIIRKAYSQREDSYNQFLGGNRIELAEKEKEEMNVLKELLPAELSEDLLNEYILQAILEIGSSTKKDFGKILKKVSELSNGAVDNKTLSAKLSQILT